MTKTVPLTMEAMILHRSLARRTRTLASWHRAPLGLLVLSVMWNLIQEARIEQLEASLRETEAQLEQAELSRDRSMEKLGELSRQSEAERQARAEQAAAFEAVGSYRYIGECAITAYCPCETCCGKWADGLTATGLQAGPGIVAVDPEVIPLGSTVVIDGQRYLAADTGVTGLHVDVCAAAHQEAEAFGVRTAAVWIKEG